MRVRAYSAWQTAQQTLSKKREQEQKLTASGKIEKLQAVKAEIQEVGVAWAWLNVTYVPLPLQWEGKVEETQKAFEDASKTLKTEVTRFEVCKPLPHDL